MERDIIIFIFRNFVAYTHILHALGTVATRHNNNATVRQEFHTWPVVSVVMALFRRRRSLRRTPGCCQSRFGGLALAATSTRITACRRRRYNDRWARKMPTGTGFFFWSQGDVVLNAMMSSIYILFFSVLYRRAVDVSPPTPSTAQKQRLVERGNDGHYYCDREAHETMPKIETYCDDGCVLVGVQKKNSYTTTTPPAPGYWRH